MLRLLTAPADPRPSPTALHLLPPAATARSTVRAGRLSLALVAVLWIGAVGAACSSLAGHPVTVGPLHVGHGAVPVWRADRLAVVLALLVTTVALVVTSFATRYLRDDRRAVRFFVLVPATVAATLLLAGATTIVGLAAGWSLSGLGVLALVGLHRPSPGAAAGHRATRRAFLVGDAALWAAVVVVLAGWGDVDLQRSAARPDVSAGHGAALVALAVLVPVAVAARCGLAPFGRWLPGSLAAPTPVSAFLHAGLVNAGGILLVRLAPLTGGSHVFGAVVFVLGATTVGLAGASAMTEPSVKGTLVRSTSAQMGFMVACCGLGWYVAAVLHLVAHGLYKSTLLLGSGGAVAARTAERAAPPRSARRRAATAAAALVGPAVAVGWALSRLGDVPDRAPLVAAAVLGWATAAAVLAGALWRLASPGTRAVAVAVVSALAGAYVVVVRSLATLLSPAVPGIPAGAVPAAAGIAALTALAALTAVVRHPRLSRTTFGRRAWVTAAGFGRPVDLVVPARDHRPPLPRPSVPERLGTAA